MGGTYLEIAQYVLEARAKPLTAQEILADAQRYGLLPDRLTGATMQKTLQARIAEDIFRNRSKSKFYRTSIGTYYLRDLAGDVTLPTKVLNEHPTSTRRRPDADQRGQILHIDAAALDALTLQNKGVPTFAGVRNQYAPMGSAPEGYLPVSTISILRWRGKYLTHIVGKYSRIYNGVGERVLGLKRYVDEFDIDLIEEDGAGLRLSSIRESARIVPFIERSIYSQTPVGTIKTETDLSVLFLFSLHDGWTGVTRRRLDVNKPQWLDLLEIGDLSDEMSNNTARIIGIL